MKDDILTVMSNMAAIVGLAVAIIVPLIAWRSKASREKRAPNRESVEQLERLFLTAAYNADVLAKGGEIDESLYVEKFKEASFKMHEVATVLLEKNAPNSVISKAVTEFYEAFRAKESLSVCKARMDELKKLV